MVAPRPVLHLIVGSNGAGKTTFFERVLEPVTDLPFINADRIAKERWPDDFEDHAYEAAQIAEDARRVALEARRSFVGETLFSHPSKLDLLQQARDAGYWIELHVILIPEVLAVPRVASRVAAGGHDVPDDKIVARYRRLWEYVREGISLTDVAEVLDNSRAATPYRVVARYEKGRMVGEADWPPWTPDALRKS